MIIAGARSFIAFLFILAVRRLHPIPPPRGTRAFPMFMAAFFYAATMILFVIANKMTASANVILLQYIAPVWAAFLGWIIAKERPRSEHWVAMGAIAVGLYVFFKNGLSGGSNLGNGIAVISGVTFGAYSVFMRLQKKGRPEDSVLLAHLFTALICFPFLFVVPPIPTAPSIGAILALGILQIGVASLLFAYAIRRITAVQAMLTAVVEPVLNPLWVFVVTGEKPSPSALLGGSIILAAVIASSIIGARRQAA